jgi:hypothetical protein
MVRFAEPDLKIWKSPFDLHNMHTAIRMVTLRGLLRVLRLHTRHTPLLAGLQLSLLHVNLLIIQVGILRSSARGNTR